MREAMRRKGTKWTVILSAAASTDYSEILDWTAHTFGEAQSETYAEVLNDAIAALARGPATLGVKSRKDVEAGLYSLAVARRGRKGRHLLIFRVLQIQGRQIQVLRILHDSMDVFRHLPPASDAGD